VQPVTIVPGEFLDLGATTFSKTSSLLSKAADYLGLNLISFDDGTGDLVGQGKGNFGVYVFFLTSLGVC
jgi:hypothetical protein